MELTPAGISRIAKKSRNDRSLSVNIIRLMKLSLASIARNSQESQE